MRATLFKARPGPKLFNTRDPLLGDRLGGPKKFRDQIPLMFAYVLMASEGLQQLKLAHAPEALKL